MCSHGRFLQAWSHFKNTITCRSIVYIRNQKNCEHNVYTYQFNNYVQKSNPDNQDLYDQGARLDFIVNRVQNSYMPALWSLRIL